MSIETDVVALLQARCDNVYRVLAPHGSPLPRLVHQHVGGRTMRYMENTAALRNVLLHISSWAETEPAAFALIRQVEDDLCAHPTLQVTPQGEPIAGIAEGENTMYGATQIFSIFGPRD